MFLSHQKQNKPELETTPENLSPSLRIPPATMPRISSSLEKYGWFEDFDHFSPQFQDQHDHNQHPHQQFLLLEDEDEDIRNSGHRLHERELSLSSDPAGRHSALQLPLPLTEPPSYILEAPLTSQHLWYKPWYCILITQ